MADKQLKQTPQKVGKETVLVISNTVAEMREYVGSNQTLFAILIMCGRQRKELLVANRKTTNTLGVREIYNTEHI